MMIVRELWREALRHPRPLVSSIVLLTAVSATHVAQAVLIAVAMAAAVHGDADTCLVALATVAGVVAVRAWFSSAQVSSASTLGGLVRLSMRSRALRAALRPENLHDPSLRDGRLRATLTDGVDGTDAYVADYVPSVVQVIVVCPALVVALLCSSPAAAGAVAVGIVVALTGPRAWKRLSAPRGRDHWDSYGALSADLLEALRGMTTIRALGDVDATRRLIRDRSESLRRATERSMRVSLAETGVTDLAVQAGLVAAASVAIIDAARGDAPATNVYLVLMLSSEAFRPIRDLSRHWHSGFLGVSAVPGLAAVGAFTEVGVNPEEALPSSNADELRIDGVTFQYPESDSTVLDGVSLIARIGRICAIVGESGAGKSTLLDLILGFLKPASGVIEVDGRTVDPRDVAVVSQHPVLFAGTVRANLTAVREDAGRADIRGACLAAGVLADLDALPNGLETVLGEGGEGLSGGQRQRVALARALLTERPVLLVDEPTSALDAEHAAAVLETLGRVARDRIVVMVTHRLEALTQTMDVHRLENGQLIEVAA
ncbi:ATP-binding cassette domain-containing protein [Gordonia malaquae]|uniref:ABC transporter ATP-binding protein/permease n=1 Tax=Gordonia malaquae TaxID=410332 RepID=UPI0030C79EA5